MMATNVKASDIQQVILPYPAGEAVHSETELLPGEIPGVVVCHYTLPQGERLTLAGQDSFIRILFLLQGKAGMQSAGKTFSFQDRAVFADLPQREVELHAESDCCLLEIRWSLNEQDLKDLDAGAGNFPYAVSYEDAIQYRDFFKSEKTISRALIPQSIIPRFAMGSVEMAADDLVGQHSHPLLDQYFFSFPENDMYLLIDSCIFPMKGNTLLHIPLGSNHGVLALGQQRAHYLWLDFTPPELKEDAVAYLNEVHKPTGEKRAL